MNGRPAEGGGGRVFGLSASQLLVRHSFDHTKRSTWNARAET